MKAKFTLTILFTLMMLVFSEVQSQSTLGGTIKGKITNADKEPIAGINVSLEGTTNGTATDSEGNYTISALEEGSYTIVVSGISYSKKREQIKIVKGKTIHLNFSLNENTNELTEVVVESGAYKTDYISPSLRLLSSIIETPQNIQVVTNDIIGEQQIFDMLEGVSRNVSGVTMLEHWDNYARLNMRGSRIAPFRNGFNIQSSWGPLAEDMSMVERIEFVKGPAGFMMSNGEPSGFYNVVTKKPTGVTKGMVNLSLGSFDTYRATTDLDGKLSKDGKLLYRLNLSGRLRGSHRDFEFNNRYSIAPVIKYQINDRTSVTAEYTYQFAQMSAIGSAYVFSANKYGDLPKNSTTAEPNLDPTNIRDHSAFLILDHRLNDNWKLTAQVAYFNYNQVGSSLWIDSVKTNGDLYRNVSIWDAANEGKFGQVFVSGKVKTGFVSHKILAGLDLGNKRYMADWNQSFPLSGPTTFNIYNPVHYVPAESLPVFDRSKSLRYRAGSNILSQSYSGLYLQDELGFVDNKIRLTLAGRLTSVKDSEYGTGTDETVFTPRVGLSGSIDKNTSVYALYDQAFVPEAGSDFHGKAFKPVTGHNMEAGFKKDWYNGKWNSTISIYQITKNNVVTNDPEHINFSTQLGQTKTRGVELDIRGEIVSGLNLTVNYAYTDSEVTKDTNSENIGNPVPGSTKHINNGWLSYKMKEGVLKGFGVSAGYQWQIERSSWFVFDGTEQSLPDYFRMDGAISWQNDDFSVSLNVNNILNEYLFSGSPYGGYYYYQTEAGRNFRLSVGYKF